MLHVVTISSRVQHAPAVSLNLPGAIQSAAAAVKAAAPAAVLQMCWRQLNQCSIDAGSSDSRMTGHLMPALLPAMFCLL